MSDLSVQFWGTRGSIPTPGRRTEKYGGNTTCLEIRCDDQIIVIDAGSGIRAMSDAWMGEFKGEPIQASLFFTHLHWDHIQGFPFFTPAYVPGNSFDIYGELRPDGGVKELLSGQMQGSYFPVPLAAMQAQMQFQVATPRFSVGPLNVTTYSLPHPGGCLGYRLGVGESTFVLATDSELDQVVLNRDELKENHLAPREFPPELLNFLVGANLLVIDCQYTDSEYKLKTGWGHNSIATVVDLCTQIQPGAVALTHHDPQHDDGEVARMTQETATRLEAAGVKHTALFAAREGLKLRVQESVPPLSLVW